MVAERDAEIGRIEAEIERLKATAESDQGRVEVMERSRELARAQFERARVLLEEHVGNQLDVDRSEQSYNDATDRLRQLQTVLNTYPMAIREAEKRLAAAKSALERAHLDLARTELYAPFAGRIDAVLIEALGAGDAGAPSIAAGHYAEAGRPLFVLADDTRMEVPIKLDARDVHQWLRRTETANGSELVAVECVVAWTEIDPAPEWSGTLGRIEDYTSATRTVTAVVSVDLALQNTRTVPLAAGMFCSVRLPGNAIDGVFAVPQSAVSVDGTVYLAIDERLVSRPVHVARAEGGTAYVDSGIEAGDLIVTTRLVNPIEGTLLRVAKNGMAGTE